MFLAVAQPAALFRFLWNGLWVLDLSSLQFFTSCVLGCFVAPWDPGKSSPVRQPRCSRLEQSAVGCALASRALSPEHCVPNREHNDMIHNLG